MDKKKLLDELKAKLQREESGYMDAFWHGYGPKVRATINSLQDQIQKLEKEIANEKVG